MKITNLPLGIQEFLANPPKAGNGVHRWLFRAALLLHRGQTPRTEMPRLLAAAIATCGRPVSSHEIKSAIQASERLLRGDFEAAPRIPKWPEPNQEQIEAIVNGGSTLTDLEKMSPINWNDGKSHSEEVIDALFPGNPLLCIGQTKYRFNTMQRENWRGLLAARQFIVPSPMSKIVGLTKEGKPSTHTLDNTGPRKFLVIEFDQGTFDSHAAVLVHLAQYTPLVLAVHSGGKSLHGWFFVSGWPDAKIEQFFHCAVSLGADSQLWTRSQFVRLPDGRRENGKRQEVIYFNPQPLPKI